MTDSQLDQKTNSELTQNEMSSETDTHLSSCLQNLSVNKNLQNSDVEPVNTNTTKNVSNSCCVSEARDSSNFFSTTEEQNLSNTEAADGNVATGRHCVAAFPGHQKNKRILEVK